jgi:hypothetical protein
VESFISGFNQAEPNQYGLHLKDMARSFFFFAFLVSDAPGMGTVHSFCNANA